jgi:hypothetical protein
VVEQFNGKTALAQALGKAARLPVGAVIDAAVKGEDADGRRAHGRHKS